MTGPAGNSTWVFKLYSRIRLQAYAPLWREPAALSNDGCARLIYGEDRILPGK